MIFPLRVTNEIPVGRERERERDEGKVRVEREKKRKIAVRLLKVGPGIPPN